MSAVNYFFAVANILFFISIFPMFVELWHNRDALRGFSFNGALLTAIGLVFMNIGYLSYNLYVNVLLSLPLLFYWIMVVYYTAKARAVVFKS